MSAIEQVLIEARETSVAPIHGAGKHRGQKGLPPKGLPFPLGSRLGRGIISPGLSQFCGELS